MEYPGFINGSDTAQSPIADQERTVNWYLEKSESTGASVKQALYPTPGVSTLVDTAAGTGRAHWAQDGREFAIVGATLWEVGQFGTLTSRGTVAAGFDPCTISGNGAGGDQLFITAGGNGYYYNLTTDVLTQVAALNGLADMGDQIDGYFIILDASTSTMYISDLLDGSTWDPTQFIQRSIASDPWVSMKVANRYIYLFGSETSEVWYDAGTFPIPFAAHPSGLMQYGCDAAFSPELVGGAVCWLGRTANGSGSVLRTSGFTPEILSTFATEVAFNAFSNTDDAIGDSYEDLGHTFYVLTFPLANSTWVWDESTNNWHERGTWNTSTAMYEAWRPLYHVFAFNQHRMLDLEGSIIYLMSSDTFTDAGGGVLRRLRRAPALVNEGQRMFYSSFELNMEVGLGAVTGQGVNPEVMMRMSNDGGKTWSTEQIRSAGALGNYQTRVRWNRCGSARRRVFEVTVSDPISWKILGAWLTLKQGAYEKLSK